MFCETIKCVNTVTGTERKEQLTVQGHSNLRQTNLEDQLKHL